MNSLTKNSIAIFRSKEEKTWYEEDQHQVLLDEQGFDLGRHQEPEQGLPYPRSCTLSI